MPPPSKTYTREQVREHTEPSSLWFIIDSTIYDVTSFIDEHPGGETVLRQVAGQDATTAFYNLHRHEVLSQHASLVIGTVADEKPQVLSPEPGDLSPVPYAEPLWLTTPFRSPYYKESHHRFRRAVREFTQKYIAPEALECEATGRYISQDLVDRMEREGMLRMRLGPGEHLQGRVLLGGVVEPEEFDYFHFVVLAQEICRPIARGFQDGNLAGMAIGMSAFLNFAPAGEWKTRITDEVLGGKKRMCLAVTEAFAGSDVAHIRTTAERTADGEHFIVNGTKKWITNGIFSDYFITMVRTGQGFSVLLIPRGEGVETKLIKTSYSSTAGTAFVTFENVKVPVTNLLGEENKGLKVVLRNFNHERWGAACAVISQCRLVVEETLKWANQRIIFGKRLVDQPVVRQKLAKMIALVEANQSWLESLTYQMCNMPYAEQNKHLAGPIGLFKMNCTRAAHEIADESIQIWGGRGLTNSGMGRTIEEFHRTYKFDAILAGSEEVIADLGVRQAMRNFPKAML